MTRAARVKLLAVFSIKNCGLGIIGKRCFVGWDSGEILKFNFSFSAFSVRF